MQELNGQDLLAQRDPPLELFVDAVIFGRIGKLSAYWGRCGRLAPWMALVCHSKRPTSTATGSPDSLSKASVGCLDVEGKDDIAFSVFNRLRDRTRFLMQRETETTKHFDTGLKNQVSTPSIAELNIEVSELKKHFMNVLC